MVRYAPVGISIVGPLVAVACVFSCGVSSAALIVSSLGNTSPGFASGSTPSLIPQIQNAQAGQPAPFNAGSGNDLFAPNASFSWTHNYGAIAQPIVAADLILGIAQHDSAQPGNQVAALTIDALDFSATANIVFESFGGALNEYNVYPISMPPFVLPALMDGSANVVLTLQGPSPNGPNNGAFLISSVLQVLTQDDTTPPSAAGTPEPSALLLTALSLVSLGMYRSRHRSRAAGHADARRADSCFRS